MAIMKNRPLFSACLLYIICAFCAYFSSPSLKIILLFVSICALIGCIVCIFVKKLPRKVAVRAAALCLCAVLAFAGSWIAFDANMQKYERMAEKESCLFSATVTERKSAESMTVYRVRVHAVDDRSEHFDATMVCDFTSYLQVGDSFEATGKPSTLADAASAYYDGHYALASGLRMQFTCEDETQIASATQTERFMPAVSLTSLNQSLCRIMLDVCGTESGGLACALLLGNKSYLDSTLARDFSRAGASHILALSGMHVSILMGAIGFALAKLHVHRKARAVLLAAAALGYLVLTGMSVSAPRAVVMVCILQLSYLLAADNDTLTTLGLVGAGIILLDPYTVCDTGFILSFLATFGIVVLVPPLHEFLKARTEALAKPPHHKIKKYLFGTFSAIAETLLIGFIACFAVFVPSCFLIGNMSLFSPLTTLLLSPMIAAMLVLSTLSLMLSPIPPLANLFGTLIRLLYAIITPYVEKVSQIDGALLPLSYNTVSVLGILLCCAAFLLLIFPLRKKWLLALPPALLAVSLCIFFPVNAAVQSHTLHAAYTHPSAVSEALVCADGYRAYICDLSSGTSTAMRAATYAADELHTTEIGAVLLTDCSSRHAAVLGDLMSDYKTDCIYLPRTADADALDAQARIREVADMHGVPVVYYEYGEPVAWYDGAAITVHSTRISRSTQPAMVVTLQKDDAQICMLNTTVRYTEIAAQAESALAGADTVVCMERGPKPKLTYALDAAQGCEVVFATSTLASFCDPESLRGVKSMTLCPEIAYFSIATEQNS